MKPDDGKQRQRLFVISGPSGSGKATLLSYVTERSAVRRVVTYTTRRPRPGEVDGIDYNFLSEQEFDDMYEAGDLVERERVYGDYFYGSPRNVFANTHGDVIMELDTKGTDTYRKIYDDVVTIFILPPSIEELVRRIQARYREANIERRLAAAKPQLESASSYDHIVINDILERAGDEILAIVNGNASDREREPKLKLAASLIETVSKRHI